jgi:hypothetical protein
VAGRRTKGSQTRSASSIRLSTCDKAPTIRAAIGRDNVFCVSVDRSERGISRESIGTPRLVLVRNRLTCLDFAAGSTVAAILSTPNYEGTVYCRESLFSGNWIRSARGGRSLSKTTATATAHPPAALHFEVINPLRTKLRLSRYWTFLMRRKLRMTA